jgi:hypothetical protein
VGVAVVIAGTAWISRPRPLEDDLSGGEGELLCPDLTKPELARSLAILDFDEKKSELRPFKVVQEKGVWRIPSHENYPADAAKQLGEAAASVVDLRKGPVVSNDAAQHEDFGVVLPNPDTLTPGAMGVGKRVIFADKDGKMLADFIIGKAVGDRPDLHYVRLPDQDAVYQVAVKTEKLSTRFDDWIEKDLLKINSLDIKKVDIEDYTVDEAANRIRQRGRIGLEYDGKAFKWKLALLQTISEGDARDETLADDEELNSSKLNEMKQAIDDLKIVDVRRKPKQLGADLKASEDFRVSDRESFESLIRRGFFPVGDPQRGGITLYANEGDIRCATTNGVEYVLRFGNIAGKGNDPGDESDKRGAEEKVEAGENRYVMITAEFNQDLIAVPELTALDDKSPTKESPEKQAPSKELGDEAAEDADDGAPEADDPAEVDEIDEALEAAFQESDGDDDQGDDSEGAGDGAKELQGKSSSDSDESAAGDDDPPSKTKKEPAGPKAAGDKPKLTAKQKVERDRVEKENQRKQDAYDKQVEDGRKLAKQLNSRFADWYYVVSDATYKKIHLRRDDVIKKKDKPAGDTGSVKHDGHDHDDDEPGAELNLRKLDKELPDEEE